MVLEDLLIPSDSDAGGSRPTRPLKTSELLAREIVRSIAEDKRQPGDNLPPEMMMVQQYGVGRTSVREALRILEIHGLIHMKPGRNGGPVVAHAGPDQIGRVLSLFMDVAGAVYGDLADFMLTVSPHLAELAARNPNREEVRTLLTSVANNPCALHPIDSDGPHGAINKLSGNPLLAMFADAVDAVFSGHVMEKTRGGVAFMDQSIHEHHLIADAVLGGRSDDARRLMTDHVKALIAYSESALPGLLTKPVEWR